MIRVAVDAMGGDRAPQAEIAAPEVFAVTGDLQLPVHRNWSHQLEPQALESRIVGREFALGPHGTAPKVPDIHAQHSRLT